jgi:hypothetical protein
MLFCLLIFKYGTYRTDVGKARVSRNDSRRLDQALVRNGPDASEKHRFITFRHCSQPQYTSPPDAVIEFRWAGPTLVLSRY